MPQKRWAGVMLQRGFRWVKEGSRVVKQLVRILQRAGIKFVMSTRASIKTMPKENLARIWRAFWEILL
jgi:ubiquinone/menaquinone biosynthesis C-methylase UbiE